MNYSSYKDKASSEKLVLSILSAAKRLTGFTLHSGAIYKKTSIEIQILERVEINGIALQKVESLSAVVEGSFFNDRENQILYFWLQGSGNPSSSFVSIVQKFFFASTGLALPYDLASGEEVYFEPQVDSTSTFGVEIDTVNQQNEAIEGTGTLTLINDQNFWPKNFDKLAFENQVCEIYSYSRELEPSEAKLLFRGKVESKTYSSSKIQFKLKDLMADLKSTIALSTIGSLNERTPANLNQAYQRMIFGRANGFRPFNIDALQNGSYPISGSVSVSNGSAVVTGSSTLFLKELSPDDILTLSGVDYTVASVDSDTSITLTENYASVGESGLSVEVKPASAKRWMNRVWKVAGHSLNEPLRTTLVGSSTSRLFISSTQDIRDGDRIYVGSLGSGELVTVDRVVNSTQLILSESLSANPIFGTAVRRPAVQKLRLNDTELLYYRDFTLDASTSILTLRESAEINAAQTRESMDCGRFAVDEQLS